MEIMRERELRVQLEKQLVDERNLRSKSLFLANNFAASGKAEELQRKE